MEERDRYCEDTRGVGIGQDISVKENKDKIISEIEASDDNHRGNEKTTLKKEKRGQPHGSREGRTILRKDERVINNSCNF
jgi:hypothetical protein